MSPRCSTWSQPYGIYHAVASSPILALASPLIGDSDPTAALVHMRDVFEDVMARETTLTWYRRVSAEARGQAQDR
jgi:hypothetical protein